MYFKNIEEKLGRESSKRTISASGGLGHYKWYQSRHRAMCQREGWAQRGWTRGGVPTMMLGPEGRWIGRSHIDWRRKWVLARMLDSERGRLWDPTFVGEESETPFIRVWKPLPRRRVLKTMSKSPIDNICPRRRVLKKLWVKARSIIPASGRLGPLQCISSLTTDDHFYN